MFQILRNLRRLLAHLFEGYIGGAGELTLICFGKLSRVGFLTKRRLQGLHLLSVLRGFRLNVLRLLRDVSHRLLGVGFRLGVFGLLLSLAQVACDLLHHVTDLRCQDGKLLTCGFGFGSQCLDHLTSLGLGLGQRLGFLHRLLGLVRLALRCLASLVLQLLGAVASLIGSLLSGVSEFFLAFGATHGLWQLLQLLGRICCCFGVLGNVWALIGAGLGGGGFGE